ncbi:NADP-dependent phosphogluconate dehydrogenase [Sabulilitoribacter multivorans]|uniref:6-phosphogluconate dehydrogenase, decarboxylating n=1 Tax=Flaviramulus multivorans TaxID=1304750 RepID=A0ABS9II65_9FLAO|nr:NADP-dependent phosphogluconate dehydrogenase [Flaviramulus multivorans]MCF7560340.1 NADP-dependent phosphogluconate dehydrogenase [Flaviramulus multivorans]
MSKSQFGVIGLGVMGKSLSLNIAEKGFKLSVYNRSEGEEANVVKDFLNQNTAFNNISGHTSIDSFIASLETPRKILMMIKAGSVVDAVIKQLEPYLNADDILIDGGNSHYLDTKNRYEALQKKGIHFIGCGISGGEEGARKGPSMMPGGNIHSYSLVAPILEKISARDKNNKACCCFIANNGAGHFVKMIHNGVEYSEMQLLAELYAIMSLTMSNEDISKVFSNWNKGDLSSYLLEITANILTKKEGNTYIVDTILDKAGNKGTGSWSSKTALEIGIPTTMMTSAVFARYLSSFKEKRVQLSQHFTKENRTPDIPNIKDLENAYRFARIINHQQGFDVINEAAKAYNWTINLSELARIWTNGCIIRSELMQQVSELFKNQTNLFDNIDIINQLKSLEPYIEEVIKSAISNRVPLDTFWSSYNYWVSMTSAKLPANIIQAQRDYFGAHTYQKIDAPLSQFFHTNW